MLVAAVAGVVCLAALVPAERRRRAPMLRLSLFASRQFDAINVMTVLLYGALYAAGYLIMLQCELRLGYSATQAGAALIPGRWSSCSSHRSAGRWSRASGRAG